MTRQIVAVCRSSKKKRKAAAEILDRYLWRIGDRTWRGYATNACLDRISKDLRKRASRQMSVCIYELRSSHKSMTPIFMVGSRAQFSEEGLAPVSVSRSKRADPQGDSTTLRSRDLFRHILGLSALMHDFGKATILFQDKLRQTMKKNQPLADAVRHEVFSAFMVDALLGKMSDAEVITTLATPETLDFDAAAAVAGDACFDLFLNRASDDFGARLMFACLKRDMKPASGGEINDHGGAEVSSLASALVILCLSHHRLPEIEKTGDHFKSGTLVSSRDDACLTRKDMNVAPGTPIWKDERWLADLRKHGTALEDLSPILPGDFARLPDLAFYGRTALILADHLGSKQSEITESWMSRVPDDIHLANSKSRKSEEDQAEGTGGKIAKGKEVITNARSDKKKYPADTLFEHTSKVHTATRGAVACVLSRDIELPGIIEERCPKEIRTPPVSEGRFAWQYKAAQAARSMVSARQGGFFACILAGTGTGKTRGAPAILASACYGDADPSRRKLRYCLGLGLRTLATQSGHEYVKDLGFSEADVATLVGGPALDWSLLDDCEDLSEVSGSENRFLGYDLDVRPAEGDIPEEGTETQEWLSGLGLDCDVDLSVFLARSIENERTEASLRRFLMAPILSATIDHVMPAADARRGGHVMAMLRVMSSDLVIDEADLFCEEDLSAILRLAYLCGAFGRRLIAMSATLSEDIANELHSAYCAGWARHAAAFGAPDHVNVLTCSDDPGSIRTNGSGEGFSEQIRATTGRAVEVLSTAPALRRARMLPAVTDMAQLAEIVSKTCEDMHWHFNTRVDGINVSVGIVRMTRVDHVQKLARQVDALGHPAFQHRVQICLHGRMPMVWRQNIERSLKRMLTRKEPDPDRGLRTFLMECGLLDILAEQNKRELSIIVFASSVIETGNDLDFDYGIADPSSLRSVIQLAGRVNRHRCHPVDRPNIALLDQYLVSALSPDGKMSRPGIETRLYGTGVDAINFEGYSASRRFPGGCIDQTALDVIDARLLLDGAISSPLRRAEIELRRRMFTLFPSIDSFKSTGWARFAASYGRMRRFRRTEGFEVGIRPTHVDGLIDKWSFADAKGRDCSSPIRMTTPEMVTDMVFDEDLGNLLKRFGSSGRPSTAGEIQVPEERATDEGLTLDLHLGLLYAES